VESSVIKITSVLFKSYTQRNINFFANLLFLSPNSSTMNQEQLTTDRLLIQSLKEKVHILEQVASKTIESMLNKLTTSSRDACYKFMSQNDIGLCQLYHAVATGQLITFGPGHKLSLNEEGVLRVVPI
jgi:hypothetical protein